MALGPRIDLRQSQSLVMTPQLQQAIKLLALSNVEIEAFIAEELAKNPLLEATSSDDEGEAPAPEAAPAGDGDEAPDPTGSDELIASLGGSEDQPLDYDSREAALDTDSLVRPRRRQRRERRGVRLRPARARTKPRSASICSTSFTACRAAKGCSPWRSSRSLRKPAI